MFDTAELAILAGAGRAKTELNEEWRAEWQKERDAHKTTSVVKESKIEGLKAVINELGRRYPTDPLFQDTGSVSSTGVREKIWKKTIFDPACDEAYERMTRRRS